MKTYNIEISEGEYIDREAIKNIRLKQTNPDEEIQIIPENIELYDALYDVNNAMYPLHDILVKTKDIELKAYLAEVILKLNAMRARLKNDEKTYA